MSNVRFTRPDNFPPVVKNLIIINVLVWIAQLSLDKQYNLTNILALWPPSRRYVTYQNHIEGSRRFFHTYRTGSRIPLGDWVADLQTSGTRLTEFEERMKLQRDSKDRDMDGVPDNQDNYPWDRNRW